ncbi:hypothetical protein H6P81_013684 [Aristolochia fimbriata]|uniref:Gag-pol polyprotein n=1 Tax=Aristolochia fimbriata TaxID=158543 RepID=A0AAV7EIM9_ARIFI|nr:hypothetical protein H6P81_013684 [Aristolochia fimbriata]
MEPQKEVVQAVKPPVLDGTNFPYWKTRKKVFIKALDEKAWKSVLTGWTPPTIINVAGNITIKPEVDWTVAEDKTLNQNAKALNVIFYGVDQERFKLISTCESAKDAWEVLSTTYEGTAEVRLSKLQLLNHKFENLQMEEDETIAEYDARIRDIANEIFTLGRKIPEAEQVQKVLRSLTEKFAVKVAAIEECKDLDTLKYDDLMGSLRSYEMNIDAKKKRKENEEASIALQVSKKESVTTPSTAVTTEELEEKIALLTRGFNKAFKRFGKRTISGNINRSRDYTPAKDDSTRKKKSIQCHECEGFGHVRSECSSKRKNSYAISWSDDETEESSSDGDELISNYAALTSRVIRPSIATLIAYDTESNDDMNGESLEGMYQQLLKNWVDVCKMNADLRHQVSVSKTKNSKLEPTVSELNAKLQTAQVTTSRLLQEKKPLDYILTMGQANSKEHIQSRCH